MGLSLFSKRKRPLHLGTYPMEKIKRVEKTTTLIIDDEVKRTPARANGFIRARFGDFGEKAQTEVKRFVVKSPVSAAMRRVIETMVPIQEGEVAPEKAPIPDDPKKLSEHIKALSYYLDSDLTGICEAKEYCWYSHDLDGNEIKVRHKYAIVLVIDQGFHTMDSASGDDWISSAQSFRAYMRGSEIANVIADYIRRLGYDARAHTNSDSLVQHVPLSLLAGLGEMSRIGEMILNPFIGPRLKTAVVTTDMPLAIDKPIDFGLQDFCNKCRKCARECPCGAIPYGDKIMYNGYETWKPDSEGCTKYRTTNPGGSACGRCMKMCPWNKEGLMQHRLAMWMAIKLPFTRRFLIWLDDKWKYGERNPDNRWWFDLETTGLSVLDGTSVKGKTGVPLKTNERDLSLDKKPPKGNRFTVYTPDVWPKFDDKETVRTDRKDGQARYRAAEKPEDAKRRVAEKAGD
jgi:reductive dehalogenase